MYTYPAVHYRCQIRSIIDVECRMYHASMHCTSVPSPYFEPVHILPKRHRNQLNAAGLQKRKAESGKTTWPSLVTKDQGAVASRSNAHTPLRDEGLRWKWVDKDEVKHPSAIAGWLWASRPHRSKFGTLRASSTVRDVSGDASQPRT